MSRKAKVLIVDDDKLLNEQLKMEVERNFYEVFSAHDGAAAIDILKKEDIKIILLDVNLPDMEGFEVLDAAKKEKGACEIIMITGFGAEEIAIKALRKGAIDYIEKPVDFTQLTAAMGRAEEKVKEKENLTFKNAILVVDDDEEIILRLSRFLKKEGFEVFTANSGEMAIDIVLKNKVDVIITDIQMRGVDGIGVIQESKKLYPDIEGIVVTGHKEQEIAIRALRVGAIGYLTKPINLDEMLINVNKAIDRINLNRNKLYRNRELKISSEIIVKMNEELERRIEERTQQLNETQSQLFQTAKLATLGEMSAGLAHEINQPLGGIALISMNIRKLVERKRATDEMLIKAVDDIDLSVERMKKVIQHIRTFARQETLKFIEVEVPKTIDSTLTLLGEQLRLHGIEICLEFEDKLPKVEGEPFQLEQVWVNFTSNARDAMDIKEEMIKSGKMEHVGSYNKKLTISVSLDKENGFIQVAFQDNGVGISKDKILKIFQPFFTTKEVGKATGLGLSISYGIIKNHRGEITASSVENEGTLMTAYLPILKNGAANG
ncbi:MAG: response regulator [Candidatus Omnitrophica bacterium]|nr:response regulator [Candidatus Omnitrophota bacterium]